MERTTISQISVTEPKEKESNLDELYIKQGLTNNQVEQLIFYSNTDKEVQRFTSDPKRFKDKKAFEKWRQKGRIIYTITDLEDNLLGIIWFGEEPLPQREFTQTFNPQEFGITFAIRIYGEARGKGLARKFMTETFKHLMSSSVYEKMENKGIWLETSIDNTPALKAYEKFGFKQITNPNENQKILMILKEF